EHLDARRLATDLLDLPPETQAALAPRTRSSAAGVISPRLLDAGQRLERSALAGVAAHESLLPELERLAREHFDDHPNPGARAVRLGREMADDDLKALLAELYALEDEERITLETARQSLLMLSERQLDRQLKNATPEEESELISRLAKLRDEIRAFV